MSIENATRRELKHTARTLNMLIDYLGILEGLTTIPSNLSDYCREVQQHLIDYRTKIFRKLEV